RPVLGVLVVVDEDAAPLLLPPLAGRVLWRSPFHLARDGERRPTHLVEAPASRDARVDVHATRSRRLGPAGEAMLVEDLAHDQRHTTHVVPADAGTGIEIDAKLVGVLEVVGPHGVRVQVDAPEIHDPQELRRVAYHDLPRGST